jgi:pyrimidine-nucleoside phosphorylase/thymidine phosphorylase
MIASGRARDTFREVIRLQGGDPRVIEDPSRLPHAKHIARVDASRAGYVTAIHCEQVGVASMLLGGGREKKEDSVDPAVGLVLEKKIGDKVQAGENLCTVHYNLDALLPPAMRLLSKSFEIGDQAPPATPLVRKIIGAEEIS